MLESLGRLWLAGVQAQWEGLYPEGRRRRVPADVSLRAQTLLDSDARGGEKPGAARGAQDARRNWRSGFYVPSWRRSALAAPKHAAQGPWLVFSDAGGAGGAGAALARAPAGARGAGGGGAARGGLCAPRRRGLDDRSQRREDYAELLGALQDAPPRQIVHLWSCGEPPATVAEAQGPGFYSLLWLAQALGATGWSHPTGLLVGTSQVQEVTGSEPLAPGRATVLGPCRVLGLELAHVRCAAIDLESEPEQAAGALLAEADAGAREPEVAYRQGWRSVRDYEPLRLEQSDAPPARLRAAGVYLITGGLGGVGLALAQWLATTVKARLVLVGRTALPAREQWEQVLESNKGPGAALMAAKIRALQGLEAAGAQVLTLAADVADAAQMRAALETARQRFGAIHGIIHAGRPRRRHSDASDTGDGR